MKTANETKTRRVVSHLQKQTILRCSDVIFP